MPIQHINPSTVGPPRGYSHVVKNGSTVYVAGQVARDRDGKPMGAGDAKAQFVWLENEGSFNFGQHKGRLLREIADEHPDYLGWILGQDFSPKVLEIITNALKGEFPDWY